MALQRGNALVLQRGMQQLRIDAARLGGGADRPFGASCHFIPASRSRQRRRYGAGWQDGTALQPLSSSQLAAIFHPHLRAGGGAGNVSSYRAAHVGFAA